MHAIGLVVAAVIRVNCFAATVAMKRLRGCNWCPVPTISNNSLHEKLLQHYCDRSYTSRRSFSEECQTIAYNISLLFQLHAYPVQCCSSPNILKWRQIEWVQYKIAILVNKILRRSIYRPGQRCRRLARQCLRSSWQPPPTWWLPGCWLTDVERTTCRTTWHHISSAAQDASLHEILCLTISWTALRCIVPSPSSSSFFVT